MIIRKIDAWLYGIEQRIAKWKRSRTPEYRFGANARLLGVPRQANPYLFASTEKAGLWLEGWIDEEAKKCKSK